MTLNMWNHVAVVRNSGTTTIYLNGVSVGTSGTSDNLNTAGSSSLFIGLQAGDTNGAYAGYMNSVRVVKSTAVYTAAFTPPTAPLTAITNTSLLCNFTNAGIIDNAEMNNLETVGNAQISTAQSKFGGASMAFDGTGDYLRAPSTVNWDFGTGDFTIESWVYFSSIAYMALAGKFSSGGYAWIVQFRAGDIGGGNGIRFYTGNNGALSSNYDFSWSPSTGIWYHLAVARSGSNLRLFINGTQQGSTATIGTQVLSSTSGVCTVGATGDGLDQNWNGYIDDLRITKGYARYTANFTPQRSQWQDQ
jgi:hypothetical protein